MYQQNQAYIVESRSYDTSVRGSWSAYAVEVARSQDERAAQSQDEDMLCLWLPAGTEMHWQIGTRPLRNNCLQFFWPDRWYMLSAFYDGRTLLRTYANVIRPAMLHPGRVSYTDLDLSVLIEPDMSYEVLTQVEFEQAAEQLHYNEETRISALMALRTLTSSVQRSVGLFTVVPHELPHLDVHLAHCS